MKWILGLILRLCCKADRKETEIMLRGDGSETGVEMLTDEQAERARGGNDLRRRYITAAPDWITKSLRTSEHDARSAYITGGF